MCDETRRRERGKSHLNIVIQSVFVSTFALGLGNIFSQLLTFLERVVQNVLMLNRKLSGNANNFHVSVCNKNILLSPSSLLLSSLTPVFSLLSGQVSLGASQSGLGTRSALTNGRPAEPQVSGGRSGREGTGAESRTPGSSRQ